MLNIFKNKKYDSNNEKGKLIRKIELIQTRLGNQNLNKVKYQLDRIVDNLENKYLYLYKNQVEAIDQCLTVISKYSNKTYENLLINKCEHINSCMMSEETAKEILTTSTENEDKLFKMLGDLTNLQVQIKEFDVRLNEELGKNKALWQLLNAQKQTLMNKFQILNKNYKMLLTYNSNYDLVKEVKESKDIAEIISTQNQKIDMFDFQADAEFISEINNEVFVDNEKINEVLINNFSSESSDAEYEQALEIKLMNSSCEEINRKGRKDIK